MKTALLLSWFACQSLDYGTTMAALPRFAEGNPIYGQSRGRLTAIKLSVNVGAFLWYRESSHNKKWIIPVAMASSGCAAGVVNLHTMRTR